MKTILKISLLAITFLAFATSAFAQDKKVKTFQVTKVIPHSAEKVWSVVGEDYGAIANSHPKIISSNYINGSLKAEEGAQRVCNFNEKGTQYLKEKMVNYDPANFTFVNQVFQAGKFPVDPDLTRATYTVEPIDENSSRLVFDMQFRTKPAFMGGMMKNSFKKLIGDYFIAIEHHLSTGEDVNADNFKTVKKEYTSR